MPTTLRKNGIQYASILFRCGVVGVKESNTKMSLGTNVGWNIFSFDLYPNELFKTRRSFYTGLLS